MTLRVRLLLGLVVLTAIGLAVAGAVTYRQTRADLLDRVDHQLASAAQSPDLFFSAFAQSGDDSTSARSSRRVPGHKFARRIPERYSRRIRA